MAIVSESIIFDIFAIILTLFIGLYTYFQWAFKYWERKGIPYVTPKFPFGTIKLFSSPPLPIGELFRQHYDKYKAKGHKHVGIYVFSRPMYLVLDVDYIKSILSKDFDYFVDRGVYFNERHDPLSGNLFTVDGAKWRSLRTKLTPTFTSGKMKMMFHILVECGSQMKDAIDTMCSKNCPVDIKDVLARFTTNIIGSCAFGLDCNCFTDPNSQFRKCGKRIFDLTKLETFALFLAFSVPSLARKIGIKTTPDEVTEFLLNVIQEAVKYREQNNIMRKDFLQLLIEIKNSVKDENGKGIGLTTNELAAQAFVFFAAGYETSSTTMTFCLFELTQNLEIQQNVRDEINKVLKKHNGEITYDALMEMKYMGQVIDETLRKYPPLTSLNRKCMKDYKLPDTDIEISNGTAVLIPILGLHYDPEYFPDPDVFDPDRFSEENKSLIKPYTYLPFGDGPRNCIGLRFGLIQTKVGLTFLLKNYKCTLNEKTRVPLKMDPYSVFVAAAEGDVWLNVEKI
ncbi:hypothetical protein ILUMI_11716 [Ignelater luminosus]|uniref:Cytochrome P450 n=1 Tax=Ignelater luminosus TaxID=2038154 RepID=A0A8K0CXW3_IGNLU|nr:hypothetical protein ILUMI_11716 [Ignelater luminosus]